MRRKKKTYVRGDLRSTEQPDTAEVPVARGSIKVHGSKGILVELLESLEVSTNKVVDHEDLSGQLAVVFVGGPEEGVSSRVEVAVEPGEGLGAGVLVGVHTLPLIEDERALGEEVEGVLLLLLLVNLLFLSIVGGGLGFLLLGLSLNLGLLLLGLLSLLLLLLLGNSDLLGEGHSSLDGEEVGLVDDGGEPASGVHEASAEGGVEDLFIFMSE